MSKLIRFLTDKNMRTLYWNSKGLYNKLDDATYLKKIFEARLGYPLDLDNPKTFNEKLQWLKIYDRNPSYKKMVDKYLVKEYIKSVIGEEYLIPTLGVWESFDDIDFNDLPRQFVLKCTHDSGGVVICKDKEMFDFDDARSRLNYYMKRDYYMVWREWPYKDITHRIIAEQYMRDNKSEDLIDYKLMCFNGEVKCSFVCTERYAKTGLKVTFFDREWNELPFERHYPKSRTPILKPHSYEKMIILAEKLAKNIPFVRVDFYEINGLIYFGELTFYPGSGFEEFTPIKWDEILGDYIVLPKKK